MDFEICLTAKCETNNRDLLFKPRCDRDSFGVPRLLSFPFLYLPNVEQITGISVWNEDLSDEDSLPHSEMDHWEWIDWLYYEGQNTPPGLSRLIISLMMKEKLFSKMKHSRNCECCSGHNPNVMIMISGIVICVSRSLNPSQYLWLWYFHFHKVIFKTVDKFFPSTIFNVLVSAFVYTFLSLSPCWSYHVSSSFWSIVRNDPGVYDSSAVLWRHWNQNVTHLMSDKVTYWAVLDS